MKKLQILIIMVILLYSGLCEDLHFGRAQVCIEQGVNSCIKWNTTVELTYYYYSSNYMCFPASTRVLTTSGPKQIRQISVGDQIFAYDSNQGKNVYSPVTAWLHRDTSSEVDYTKIIVDGAKQYRASAGHNIAYNHNGTIDFKYADQLQPGDELISVSGRYVVQSTSQVVRDRGLFSPVTEASNFYIFPYESKDDSDPSQSMILVHCFAQIDNPHKQEHWIYTVLHMSNWIGLNSHENLEHENYYHPITHLMTLFSKPHRKIKYTIAHGDQNHLQALPYSGGSSSSSSWSWGSGSKGYSSNYNSYYWGTSSYYSNQQQRKQNKKRQLVAVFASMMQINSVITSV